MHSATQVYSDGRKITFQAFFMPPSYSVRENQVRSEPSSSPSAAGIELSRRCNGGVVGTSGSAGLIGRIVVMLGLLARDCFRVTHDLRLFLPATTCRTSNHLPWNGKQYAGM